MTTEPAAAPEHAAPASPDDARPTLRLARPADAEAVAALADAAYGDPSASRLLAELRGVGALRFEIIAEAPRLEAPSPETPSPEPPSPDDAEDQPAGPIIGFVAFSDAEILRDQGPALDVVAVAGVGVAQAARGHGLGRDLLRVGLAHCRRRGVAVALAHARHRLFERAGFSLFAAEKLDAPWTQDTVMALTLSDAAAPLKGEARWPEPYLTTRRADDAEES